MNLVVNSVRTTQDFNRLLCIKLCFFAFLSGFTIHSYADDLPPPPRSMADLKQSYTLYLDLVINDYPTGQTIPVIVKDQSLFVAKKVFAGLNISLAQLNLLPNDPALSDHNLSPNEITMLGFSNNSNDWLDLSQYTAIEYKYVPAQQALFVNMPASWMPLQMLGRDTWFNAQAAHSSLGFLNNYSLLANRNERGDYRSNLLLEQRVFSPFGIIKNTGMYTYDRSSDGLANKTFDHNGYIRYDTNWQFDHQKTATSLLIGDIVSATKNSWGNAVRLGGIQISRDFGTRPDLITYPLPQFFGQAALPSQLDLLINGQKHFSHPVQAGPFVVNNIPFISGRGEALIVTTDAVGRQVTTSIPFYVTSALLKKHLLDYSISMGKLRKNFGIDSFNYGSWVLAIDTRYGMQNWWTIESKAEYAKDVQLIGLGSVFKLLHYGTLNLAYSHSNTTQEIDHSSARHGQQYRLGYSYNQKGFGLSISHTQRDQQYRDLSHLELSKLLSVNSQKITTAQSYYTFPHYGTVGLSYIHSQSNDLRNQLLNFSFSPMLSNRLKGLSISMTASHDLVQQQWAAALQLSFRLFANRSSVNTGYSRDFNHNYGYLSYNQSAPSQGGFGIDLGHRFYDNGPSLNQAELSYFNRYINTEAGIIRNGERTNYWLGASGALVIMKQGLFLSNRLGESFALINTDGVADILVKYENGEIGVSNKKGFVFVPSVSPYYLAKYSIDPLDLPSNYVTTKTEQRLAARRGSAIVVDFPIKHSNSATVYFLDSAHKVLPVGAIVHRQGTASSYIGLDGMAYLENLEHQNQVMIQLPNKTTCKANFDLNIELAQQQIANVTDVICHEVKE